VLWDGHWNDICWDLRLFAAVVLEAGDLAVVASAAAAAAAAVRENLVQQLANFGLRQTYFERLHSVLGQTILLLCRIRILHYYRQVFRGQ